MKILFDINFTDAQLPAGWIELQRTCTFEQGALRSNGGAVLVIPASQAEFERLVIEVDVQMISGAHLTCSDNLSTFFVYLHGGTQAITYSGITPVATAQRGAIEDERAVVQFTFGRGALMATANGAELISAKVPDSLPAGGLFELGIWEDCLVHGIRAYGDQIVDRPERRPISSKPDFALEVTVDFFDDLLHAPWTLQMFDELFAELKSWGTRRVHWIYYGTQDDGWWDNAPFDAAKHARETMANVGEIFPAAVEAAHRHGLEIYGLVKPFDMGFYKSEGGDHSPGRLPRIGGPVNWIANFPTQRRDLIMARKPGLQGTPDEIYFTRIDLVKENDIPAGFSVSDLRIFVSSDNATYQEYSGPITRSEVVENYPVWEHTSSGGRPTGEVKRSLVMRLDGLEIASRYVVLSVDSRAGSFTNTLVNLLHVFGPAGEQRLLTYGTFARGGTYQLTENVSAAFKGASFERFGIQFDVAKGTPPAVYCDFDSISAPWSFDSDEGLLAFAAGKDDGTIAALSPSYPESRQWWLTWVEACLAAGADGIEIRVRNHHAHLTWGEFGFEAPIRDEFLARYGVDLWTTDDFDRVAWSHLRGEGYTHFLREAKDCALFYGKPMGVHFSPTNFPSIDGRSAMNIFWDWRRWIDEGIADSITLKEVLPGSRLAKELFAHAQPRRIRVIYSPYANDLWLQPNGELVCRGWIELARAEGCDGYQFYECASAIRATKEGTLKVVQPALREVFQECFAEAGLAS